jgi:hypothetical protein
MLPAASVGRCKDTDRTWCLKVSSIGGCEGKEAMRRCARTCGACGSRLPRVFIYPDPAWEEGLRKLRFPGNTQLNGTPWGVYPWAFVPGRATMHGNDIRPLLYERMRQHAAPPDQADLFVSFWAPYHPPFHEWTTEDHREAARLPPGSVADRMPLDRLELINACRSWLDADGSYRRRLTHLSPLTQHRHIIVPRFEPQECASERAFADDVSFVRRIPRLLASQSLSLSPDYPNDEGLYHYSVPYLGSVRWSAELERGQLPPWQDVRMAGADRPRPQLASYCGSASGTPEAQRLRRAVIRSCAASSACVRCTMNERGSPRGPLAVRLSSVFCLEPRGYGIYRRSAMDSFLCGGSRIRTRSRSQDLTDGIQDASPIQDRGSDGWHPCSRI